MSSTGSRPASGLGKRCGDAHSYPAPFRGAVFTPITQSLSLEAAMNRTRTSLALAGLLALFAAPARTQQPDTTLWARLRFRFVGPEGNRASAIAGEPGNPMVVYIGAASGGVWKTEDGGVQWRPVFDSEPAQAIGALAVAPSAHNVVWAGTGETFIIRSLTAIGNGVYKSTDAGRSWNHMGLDSTGRVGRIVIHPTNPDVVYACALGRAFGPAPDRGVYRTTDGGKTWSRVLFVDANTGCADLAMDPGDPNVLFAGMWQLEIKTWNLKSGGPGSGLGVDRGGGATLARSGFGAGGDNHDIWVDPQNADRYLIAHDGGASMTLNRGKSYSRVVLPIAQMYHVFTDTKVPYFLYGNRQDDGSYRMPSNSLGGGISEGLWQSIGGCESGFGGPDTVDNVTVWAGCYDGGR